MRKKSIDSKVEGENIEMRIWNVRLKDQKGEYSSILSLNKDESQNIQKTLNKANSEGKPNHEGENEIKSISYIGYDRLNRDYTKELDFQTYFKLGRPEKIFLELTKKYFVQ